LLHTGKAPFVPDTRDLKLSAVIPSGVTLPYPKFGDHSTDFTDWLMLGNGPQDDGSIPPSWKAVDGAGDCVFAGFGHQIMADCFNAGSAVPKITSLLALQHYAAVTGYNPETGAGDNGTDVRTALDWYQKTGYADASGQVHHIGKYVLVDHTNLVELWQAMMLFESVGIGIEFPASAMTQFNARKPWSVTSSPIEGGHYIPLVGHPTTNKWICVTWGRAQVMTPQFVAKYADEAWAWVSLDRYNAVTGETAEGYKDVELERYLEALAS
jgi:hypothetical protein